MAGESWQPSHLGDLITIKHGWPFKSELFSEDLTGLPIVVAVGNFRYTGGFRFETTAVKEYRGEYPTEYELEPGDVLLVMTCQTPGGEILGVPARIPNDGRRYLHNQRLGKVVVKQPDRVELRYLYWVFLYKPFNRELCASASGTKIVHTAPSRIEAYDFKLAPLKQQQAIACILGALDDKIELNRRMNRTLEAMARAIFKSWFVDFDPVKAKAAGQRPAGLKPDLAKLFPDSFEDSELGEIPKGWKSRALPEIIQINPTRSLSKGTLAPYLDMSNMPTHGPSPDAWGMREMGSGMKYINGDTLVARITPCLENGKTAFVSFLADGQTGWGSTEYIVLRPKREIPPVFAYLLARWNGFRSFVIHQMTGSTGRQRVPADSLTKFKLATPDLDSPLFPELGNYISPMFDRIETAIKESRALVALRDALLPKLISGELRVPDPERLVLRVH